MHIKFLCYVKGTFVRELKVLHHSYINIFQVCSVYICIRILNPKFPVGTIQLFIVWIPHFGEIAITYPDFTGVNNGGTSPSEFGVEDANANYCFPIFSHVSKCQEPDRLHHNAIKSLPTPQLWQSTHYFPKVHFQRHQITTSGGKFNVFTAKKCTKITTQNSQQRHLPWKFQSFLV